MPSTAYGPWQIAYDSDATAKAYADLAAGEAEACGCGDCLNWIQQRSRVFPSEFLNFLRLLGIDPAKETEIAEYEGGMVTAQTNLYIGEYAFVGSLLTGPDCFDTHADQKGATSNLVPLFGDLEVGVSSNRRWVHRGQLSIPKDEAALVMFKVHAPRGPIHRASRSWWKADA